jgi:hypothetical protein
MRVISGFLAITWILAGGCVFDPSGVVPDGAGGTGSDGLSYVDGTQVEGDGDILQDQGPKADQNDDQSTDHDGNLEDGAVNDQQQLKPLGVGCNHDNECESGYCVKEANRKEDDKICCFMDCKIDEDEDGCRNAGTQCYSHD